MENTGLLEALRDFLEEKTKDILLKVNSQKLKKSFVEKSRRQEIIKKNAKIHINCLEQLSFEENIPYILLQFLKGEDNEDVSTGVIGITIAIYDNEVKDGILALNHLVNVIRIELLKNPVIDNRYSLLRPLKYDFFNQEYANYFFAVIETNWILPLVRREDGTLWQ